VLKFGVFDAIPYRLCLDDRPQLLENDRDRPPCSDTTTTSPFSDLPWARTKRTSHQLPSLDTSPSLAGDCLLPYP